MYNTTNLKKDYNYNYNSNKAVSTAVSPMTYKIKTQPDLPPKKFNSSTKFSGIISYLFRKDKDFVSQTIKTEKPIKSIPLYKQASYNSNNSGKNSELESFFRKESCSSVNVKFAAPIEKKEEKQYRIIPTEASKCPIPKSEKIVNKAESANLPKMLTPVAKEDSRNKFTAKHRSAKSIFNLSLEETITHDKNDDYLNVKMLAKFKSCKNREVSMKKKNSLIIRGK